MQAAAVGAVPAEAGRQPLKLSVRSGSNTSSLLPASCFLLLACLLLAACSTHYSVLTVSVSSRVTVSLHFGGDWGVGVGLADGGRAGAGEGGDLVG